ncbi:MAG: hypothetical protein ACTSR1_01175 [Candidatus Heimdallarchaeota archaeon]
MNKNDINIFHTFDEEIKTTREFYQDVSKMKIALNTERREPFIADYFRTLEQCLNFIFRKSWINGEFVYFGDWDPEYLLLGHFFEGLLRTILMSEINTELFFLKCFNDKKKEFKTLGALIEEFTSLYKILNLTKEQQTRIYDVLRYIKLQRNMHVHYHPKGYDTYSVRVEIYSLLKKLVSIFSVPFENETQENLDAAIEDNKVHSRNMKFKPVWE